MCQAVTPYLCVTTRMDAHVCAHAHKINTDRVTGNLSCSRLVAPSSAGRRVATDIWAVAHNSVKVVFLFNHGEISHYFIAIHVLISNRNDVQGFFVRILIQDFFLKKKKPKSHLMSHVNVVFLLN